MHPMTKSPATSAWLAYNDAATYVGLSRKTLERAVTANTVPYSRDPVTGRVRFHTDELDDWMRGKSVRAARRSR